MELEMKTVDPIDIARTLIGVMKSIADLNIDVSIPYETECLHKSTQVMDIIKNEKQLPLFSYKGGHEINPTRHKVIITIKGSK